MMAKIRLTKPRPFVVDPEYRAHPAWDELRKYVHLDLQPLNPEQLTATMVMIQQHKEQQLNATRLRTIDQYRAAFFHKALKTLARKVGFDLLTTQTQIARFVEHARNVRTTFGYYPPNELRAERLELRSLHPSIDGTDKLAHALDVIHLNHVLDQLERTPSTMAQELEVIADHAARIIEHLVGHGLRHTANKLVAEAQQ